MDGGRELHHHAWHHPLPHHRALHAARINVVRYALPPLACEVVLLSRVMHGEAAHRSRQSVLVVQTFDRG